jgi:hypothetical protein
MSLGGAHYRIQDVISRSPDYKIAPNADGLDIHADGVHINCKGLSATRSGTSPFPPSSKSGRAGRRSWLAHRLQALTQK